MANRPGIFPTSFLSGFECSTFLWKDKRRPDLVAETQHDRYVKEDYAMLGDLGIAVAREGIPWPLIAHEGQYDLSRLDPLIDARERRKGDPDLGPLPLRLSGPSRPVSR